jgi:hypothetical protein
LKKKVALVTDSGKGVFEEMWISELDFLMIKIYYPEEKRWISHNLGKHVPGEDIISTSIKKKY